MAPFQKYMASLKENSEIPSGLNWSYYSWHRTAIIEEDQSPRLQQQKKPQKPLNIPSNERKLDALKVYQNAITSGKCISKNAKKQKYQANYDDMLDTVIVSDR